MSMDEIVGQIKRGVDRGVQQVKRTAETVEAETKIFTLHRKIGLRVYQLWRSGQLSHPDLEEDLEQLSRLEARVDDAQAGNPSGEGASAAEGPLDATRVTSAGPVLCQGCARPVAPGTQFCTHCGKRQG